MNLKLTTEIDNYKDKIEIFSQNVQKLKEQVGMIYYDPRDGRYKKVTSKNGVLGFEAYDSITEIEFGKPDSGSATIEEKEKIDVFSPEIDDASA